MENEKTVTIDPAAIRSAVKNPIVSNVYGDPVAVAGPCPACTKKDCSCATKSGIK